MMDAKTRHELPQLLSQLLDENLDDHAQQHLGELLRSSSEARDLYVAYCDLHLDLALRTETTIAADGPPRPLFLSTDQESFLPITGAAAPNNATARGGSGALGPFFSPMAAVLAAAAVLLIAVWFRPHSQSVLITGVGQVVELSDAVWADPQSAPSLSGSLAAGPLELRSGLARLQMACGAIVMLQGPAAIELLDAKALRLRAGSITVEAPDSAVGFRVLTPTADVVDLGTEFNIAVDDTGGTEIHVSQGVVVARSSGSDAVVPIVRGEAGRVDFDQGDLVPTAFDSTRFSKPSKPMMGRVSTSRPTKYSPLPPGSRIIFLGDRATDRETHLLLINQAFASLTEEVRPRLFNAGVSFPLLFDEADFIRQISPLSPTHAVLEFGSDLAMFTGKHLLSQAEFERAITRLCRRLQAEGIEPIVATGFPLDDDTFQAAQGNLDRYNTFLRDLAARRGYRLADYERQFQDPGIRETELLAVNGRWPSFDGHRQIAKALLVVWGHADVPVAGSLELSLLPGTVTQWHYRYKTSDENLRAETVAALRIDESWVPLSLPQVDDKFAQRMADRTHSISYRDRMRGFATNLYRKDGHGLHAIAVVSSDQVRDAFINIGATLQTVWLNGERVYQSRGWSGWHAGKERIPVQLRKGENRIVIEAGTSFFLSITDRQDWALP